MSCKISLDLSRQLDDVKYFSTVYLVHYSLCSAVMVANKYSHVVGSVTQTLLWPTL